MPLVIGSPGGLAPLGFGCCPMGRHGWGIVEEQELFAAVKEALDLGVRLFDTADIYGLGASEITLGRALRGRRDEAVIATKFGVRCEMGQTIYDTSPAWIRKALDGSLERLGVDCIDLYQMHYWDRKTPMVDVLQVLENLRNEGKIRAFGVTNHDPRDPAFEQVNFKPASFSYQYSLVDRAFEALILDVQADPGPLFFSWGSLGQGLLSGKYSTLDQLGSSDRRLRDIYANFHGKRFDAIQRLIGNLRSLAADAGIGSLTQLALRWVIDRVPRALPLVGIKRPEQIRDAAGALNFRLDPALLGTIHQLTSAFLTMEKPSL